MGRIILLLLKLGICISFASAQSGFMQDGTIEQLVFAQAAVMNTPEEATLVAIKYEDATVLLDIRKKVDHFATLKASGEKDESCVSYANPNFRVMMLGNKADVLTAKVLCSELDANSRLNEGVELSAARMALHLADEAQRCSMELSASRQLAFNALVLNTNTPHNTHSNNGGFGDIYKVDVSGNFQRCKAVCIGAREGRINSWLGTRGRFIASRLATKGRNANINVTTAAMGNNNTAQLVQDNKVFVDGNVRTDDGGAGIEKALAEDSICCSSVENCLNISTCCLLENYQRDAIYSGNYSMCVTVMCAGESEARTGTGSVSTIVGPVVVPLEVIRAMINGTDPADCGSGGDTDAHNKKCSTMGSLFNWWRSLRRQAPPPLYARTQHGVSSCSNSGGGSAAGKSGKGAGGTAHMLSGQNVPTWRQYS